MKGGSVVLDSGALSAWAQGDQRVRAWVRAAAEGGTLVVVLAVVLAESVRGHGPRDARTNRVLHSTLIEPLVEVVARRAGALRSAVAATGRTMVADALVVAAAAHRDGAVVTGDPHDLGRLGEAAGVQVLDLRDLPS